MELSEYAQKRNEEYLMRVLNKKYWPYHVVTKEAKLTIFAVSGEAEKWCYKNFKSKNWRNVGNYFAFKREQDAMMFSLRWL